MQRLLIVLMLSSFALAQAAPKAPVRRPLPTAHAANDPDEGSVSGDTYTNRFFALEYTFPENLDVQDQTSFMEGQIDQSNRTFVLLAAYGTTPDEKGREGVVIVADSVASPYGPFADGADYLRKVTGPLMQQQHFEFTSLATPVDLAGVRFYRADFHKDGESYQSQLVTIRRGYALILTLTGPAPESLTRLTNSLNTLKLGPLPPAKTPAKPGPAK